MCPGTKQKGKFKLLDSRLDDGRFEGNLQSHEPHSSALEVKLKSTQCGGIEAGMSAVGC